jgi:predicted RNA-binding protein YlqC (UPF0109 family)
MAFSFLKRLFDSAPADEGKLPPMVDAPVEKGSSSAENASGPSVEDMEKFVSYVVCSLVDKPEQVSLTRNVKGDLTVIQVHCFKKDIGKVIGKSGKTISALRVLVSSASARSGQRMTVDVMDD